MGAVVVIRNATTQDIPRVIDMVERLREFVDGPISVDRIKTGETLAGFISSPQGVVMVSPGGFIAGFLAETFISRDPVAYEAGWYASDRSGLALLKRFERWAASSGATMVKMSCRGGYAQRILERSGYKVAEVQMVKAV